MKKLFTLAFTALATFAIAQKTDKPDITYNVNGNIDLMKLTDAGILVISGAGGLSGIQPGAQTAHFTFTEYGKVKEEELEFVPSSPYVIVHQGGLMSSKKSVIDYVSGKLLFATENNGWKTIAQLNVILPQNKLVIVGNRNSKEKGMLAAAVYDLASGKEELLGSLDQNAGKVGLASATPQSSGAPLLLNDMVILPTTKKLICLDLKTGQQRWESTIDKISWMSADQSGNEIYAFEEQSNGDTRIHKISTKGELLWQRESKIKGKVTRFEILSNGIAVVSDVDNSNKSGFAKLAAGAAESKIAFLSASTGENLWEKAPQTKGYIQHFYIMNDGILFGVETGGINKIAFDGTLLFKKPLSTGENIRTMAETPQGLIYITDTDANIISLQSGESIWKNPIKYKKARSVVSTYDAGNKRYLISTGNEIIAIDENTGTQSTLTSFELKEKEAPESLTVRNGGLLLSSNQNVLMIDFNGKELFHSYYKSPGQSGILKAVQGTLAFASMAMSMAAAYQGGRYGSSPGSNRLNSYGESMKMQQEGFANIATASFDAMNKRFKATSSTENAQFILTNLNEGVGLIKVNKDKGNIEKEILLKDKKPVYKVDEVAGILYHQSSANTISAFKL